MKKIITIFILIIFNIEIQSQTYLGYYHIVHKYNHFYSEDNDHWKNESKIDGSFYRNLEFDFMFDDNCQYVLTDSYQWQQLYKQKVVKLCTNQNNETKNSLRIGWCWNPQLNKIQLAFYAHINHLQSPWGNEAGREHILLQKDINTGQWVHVKMAIGKKGMYMSIDDQSVIVSRDIYSWSPGGETTFVRANSYFEFGSGNVNEGAVQDMDFYISNAILDNPEFPWVEDFCDYTADSIFFMNSNFAYSSQGTYEYYAGSYIFCSRKSSSPVEASLPYDSPFCVVEPGIQVKFVASNSILLGKGFMAKTGSHFQAVIQNVEKPLQITVQQHPVVLEPTIYYTVSNALYYSFYLYEEPEQTGLIYSCGGNVNQNIAEIEIEGYENIPAGLYFASCVFGNYCDTYVSNHIITKPQVDAYNAENPLQDVRAGRFKYLKDFNNYHELIYQNDVPDIVNSDDIEIGPNPNNGVFTIFLQSEIIRCQEIELFDLMGNHIDFLSKNIANAITIELRNKSNGIFVVSIYTDEGIINKLVVCNK